MKKTVNVGISDMKIVSAPDIVATYALGSCVGICVIDKIKQVAGLIHIMLPENPNPADEKQVFKYASTGIKEMVMQMEALGCVKIRMTAKIAGGAKMFEMNDAKSGNIGNIGAKNVEATKKALNELKIRLIAEDVGANYGRTVFFDSATGSLEIKSFAKGNKII